MLGFFTRKFSSIGRRCLTSVTSESSPYSDLLPSAPGDLLSTFRSQSLFFQSHMSYSYHLYQSPFQSINGIHIHTFIEVFS